MPVPVLRPTAAVAEKFAGVTYYVEGELVPVLHLELSAVPVYFEHYILLWKDLNVRIGIKPLKGALKRGLAGMPVFLTEASGPGQIPTRSLASRAYRTCCWEARGSSSIISALSTVTESCGCTDTATFSKLRLAPESKSILSQADGCTRTRLCRWKRSSRN